MNRVGQAFAQALRQMLKDKKEPNIASAAKRLGVTRQQFHAYLNGKLLRQERLNKAMRIWSLRLHLGEHSFPQSAFAQKKNEGAEWRQLTLFEALDSISNDDLKVNVKRTGKVFRIHVAVEIPA